MINFEWIPWKNRDLWGWAFYYGDGLFILGLGPLVVRNYR